MKADSERFDRWLYTSLLLHGALFMVVIFSPTLFPMRADTNWGSATGATGGINVKIVGRISGVPLPSPAVVREGAAANESAGFYKSEEAPSPPPPEKAEPIPEAKAPVKTTPPPPDKAEPIPETKAPVKPTPPPPKTTPPPPKPPRPAPAPKAASQPPDTPPNAVPFGQGGKPALAYGQFSTGAGAAGIGFGDGTFGDRYGWYVDAITRRISQHWLQSLIDNRVRTAPRVYLSFDIARNGTVSNVEIKQPSGIPTLDRSAMRAILASNPLTPLPPDYRGPSVNVSFYFEYTR